MMYNRYIPDAAGVYHPTRVGAEPQAAAPAPPPEPVCVPPAPRLRRLLPRPVRRSMADFCRGCCRAALIRGIF